MNRQTGRKPILAACNASEELIKPFYTVREVAERFFVTPALVYTWIREGDIECINLRQSKRPPKRIPRQAILDFEARNAIIPLTAEEAAEARATVEACMRRNAHRRRAAESERQDYRL